MQSPPHTQRPTEPSFSGVFSRPFLLFVILLLVGWIFLRPALQRLVNPLPDVRSVTPRGDLASDEASTIALFENAAPSVVHITTLRLARERTFFAPRTYQVPEGTGSGFVWDDQGHVVTNFHVIQNADTSVVRMHDGREYRGVTVGVAPSRDLAVLRIDAPAERLRPIPIGTSADLKVGQKAFAIGNPFGLDQTLTTGVISGLARVLRFESDLEIRDVIQTDAAINPGNSGGPLLDSAGRLIGVNTSIKSPSGASAGVGFAVPVDLVNQVVPRILRKGFDHRAGLGITVGPDELAADRGLHGAVVTGVFPGSGAFDAGLRPAQVDPEGRVLLGDVIVGLDEHPIESQDDLFRVLIEYEVGDVVELRVTRVGDGGVREERLRVELRPL